jgi:hypothetical protein
VLCGARADVTDFSYMTLMDKSAVKHNMLKRQCACSALSLEFDPLAASWRSSSSRRYK